MTATVNGTRVPDVETVLKRADHKWAKNRADDPAPPEYLDALGLALQQQIVGPLAERGAEGLTDSIASDLADALENEKQRANRAEQALTGAKTAGGGDQVQKLQAEKQRLEARVTELRNMVAARDGSIDRQNTTIETLKGNFARLKADLDEARAERDTARAQLRDAEGQPSGGVDLVHADNRRLAKDLDAARRDLAAANRTLDEIADEGQSRPAAVHLCRWPVSEPGAEPGPCGCGTPWPRAAGVEVEDVLPDTDPWDAVLGRVRTELAGWPGEVA